MKFETIEAEGRMIVSVPGPRLDAAVAPAFKREMIALIDRHGDAILLDLGEIDFMDSSGLGAVVGAMRQMRKPARLELARLKPAVRKVFQLTRMDRVFKIHDTCPGV
ncbi:MAG: STAS domain-containing protein [Pseudomonadota bacterium]